MTTSSYTTRIRRTAAEHQLVADFLTQYEDLLATLSYDTVSDKLGTGYDDTPWLAYYTSGTSVSLIAHGPNQRETMRVVRRAIGGQWDKGGYGDIFEISRQFPHLTDNDDERHPTIQINIEGNRTEVCQKVVTGTTTRTIPEREYQPARTEEVEQVE